MIPFLFFSFLLCTSSHFIIMMQVLGELYLRYSPPSPSSYLSLGRLEVVNTKKSLIFLHREIKVRDSSDRLNVAIDQEMVPYRTRGEYSKSAFAHAQVAAIYSP